METSPSPHPRSTAPAVASDRPSAPPATDISSEKPSEPTADMLSGERAATPSGAATDAWADLEWADVESRAQGFRAAVTTETEAGQGDTKSTAAKMAARSYEALIEGDFPTARATTAKLYAFVAQHPETAQNTPLGAPSGFTPAAAASDLAMRWSVAPELIGTLLAFAIPFGLALAAYLMGGRQ